ncbi:MAG: hypothetical protein KIS92_20980 [Planctomycetota bacterium]|nr:hypothetical protein [Planctomycetota bacterium]
MNTLMKPGTLMLAAVLGVVMLSAGAASASDRDKRPLFNTFYLPADQGQYVLTLDQNRTFTLTGPYHRVVTGTFVASDDEIALLSNDGNRHFAYNFDYNNNVAFVPTRKDTPGNSTIGRMPPSSYSGAVVFTAAQNFRAGPVVIGGRNDWDRHDNDRHDNRWDRRDNDRRDDGRWDRRDNDRRDDRWGHFETRTQQVLVEPARTERVWVPAQVETRRLPNGRVVNVTVREAHYETVTVPAKYETRETKVWVNGR